MKITLENFTRSLAIATVISFLAAVIIHFNHIRFIYSQELFAFSALTFGLYIAILLISIPKILFKRGG